MENGRIILSGKRFLLTIDRLCHQIMENHGDFSNSCIIGVQPRGVRFANRMFKRLTEITGNKNIDFGVLDVTFYRDDFRRRESPLSAQTTEINFLVEGRNVLLIDDVLYSGRTIRAALDALQHYGRPQKVELVTLVDRRFNRHLPIQADYNGITVDAVDDAYVKVEWKEFEDQDRILFFPKSKESE